MKKIMIGLLALSLITPISALSQTESNIEKPNKEFKVSNDFSFDISVYKVKGNNENSELLSVIDPLTTQNNENLKENGTLILNEKDVKSKSGIISVSKMKETEYISSVKTKVDELKVTSKDIVEDGFSLDISKSEGEYKVKISQNNIKAIEKFTTNGDTIELPQTSRWVFENTSKLPSNGSLIIKSSNYENGDETYHNVYVLKSNQ